MVLVQATGSLEDRAVLLTPNARSLPDFTGGKTLRTVPKNTCI